jgi:cytochrome c oxidase assembly protein subunit 11
MYATTFFAKNPGAVPATGRAVMSVAPMLAAKHVRKTECFCFTEQRFAAGEGREMPMVFMLDPALAAGVEEVTFAYTFYSEG